MADLKKIDVPGILSILIPVLIFAAALSFRIPPSITRHFFQYSFGLLILTLALYYLCFRLSGHSGALAGLTLTLLLFAVTLSYKWTSGFSDNGIIGGLLPYKDGKNYFYGANLILNGLPLENAGQSTDRPLYPGLVSSLLLFTGQDLKMTLAILTCLSGMGLYLSARQVQASLGVLPASLYGALVYFYFQPLIGYNMSESLGFILGCLAFAILLRTAHRPNYPALMLGLITLLAAVSARAGAFLIFPFLAVWAGWAFRGSKRYSVPAAAIVLATVLSGYVLANSVFPRLLGVPEGSSFGNFSYALYGQVRGGTGWHSAIEELGTRNPSVVYRAAWQFFIDHPTGLFIAIAKSYRDFFLPGLSSIFPFGLYGERGWLVYAAWAGVMFLLVGGVFRLVRQMNLPPASMLLAGFIGILLSIPFLPPIDGGLRFHAGTIAFFLALPAVSLGWFAEGSPSEVQTGPLGSRGIDFPRSLSVVLLTLTLVLPVITHRARRAPSFSLPGCSFGQDPVVTELHPGSYIDLLHAGGAACGLIPEVCLDDFVQNSTEKATDDFHRELIALSKSAETGIRVMPGINLVDRKSYYFVLPLGGGLSAPSTGLLSGCAAGIRTTNQRIYVIESLESPAR